MFKVGDKVNLHPQMIALGWPAQIATVVAICEAETYQVMIQFPWGALLKAHRGQLLPALEPCSWMDNA